MTNTTGKSEEYLKILDTLIDPCILERVSQGTQPDAIIWCSKYRPMSVGGSVMLNGMGLAGEMPMRVPAVSERGQPCPFIQPYVNWRRRSSGAASVGSDKVGKPQVEIPVPFAEKISSRSGLYGLVRDKKTHAPIRFAAWDLMLQWSLDVGVWSFEKVCRTLNAASVGSDNVGSNQVEKQASTAEKISSRPGLYGLVRDKKTHTPSGWRLQARFGASQFSITPSLPVHQPPPLHLSDLCETITHFGC